MQPPRDSQPEGEKMEKNPGSRAIDFGRPERDLHDETPASGEGNGP